MMNDVRPINPATLLNDYLAKQAEAKAGLKEYINRELKEKFRGKETVIKALSEIDEDTSNEVLAEYIKVGWSAQQKSEDEGRYFYFKYTEKP